MASTSKPVRKMMKKGIQPNEVYHSPKAATKKTSRLLNHIDQQQTRCYQARLVDEEASQKERKILTSLANKLYAKVPKSMRKRAMARRIKGFCKL